jgi:threonylcarbamoyladenosine tRNA methylthiotransferase MtaB
VDAVVEEARRLVAVGHVELVLTGIFLGAYAQPTALRRRQGGAMGKPLAQLLDALCTRVPGLSRLRLSSLEPGDLDDGLIAVMRAHPQCVPHFHLPLQSGSDAILRKMNRQYTRDEFLRMVEQVHAAFDRPAITTDIIVGFPGETDEAFEETVRVAGQSGFIHIHAFPFSPRQFIHGPVVNERIARLNSIAAAHSLAFRKRFLGETVEILVEHPDADDRRRGTQHGRCKRYFSVVFTSPEQLTGRSVKVKVDDVNAGHTSGQFAGFSR